MNGFFLRLQVILTCTLCIIKRGDRMDHIALLIIHAARVPHRAGGSWKMIKRLVELVIPLNSIHMYIFYDYLCKIYLRFLQQWEEF